MCSGWIVWRAVSGWLFRLRPKKLLKTRRRSKDSDYRIQSRHSVVKADARRGYSHGQTLLTAPILALIPATDGLW